MNNNTLVVVGIQWGDEGKGKMTDYLGQKADVVVRFQGGNNAGHTITFGGNKYALQSIPSGIFNPRIKNVMANGMVINPKAAIAELEGLKQRGITDFQLYISDRAAVIMPYHIMLDGAYETLKGGKNIGTTKKGIGPAYTDKYSRIGIRIGDLLDKEYFAERLKDALLQKNMELKMLGLEPLDYDTLYNEYIEYGEILKPYVCDTSILLNKEVEAGKKILFEGAQGMLLDIDYGTYPYVTSSNTTAGGVASGVGIGPNMITNSVGIAKAYTTRVGKGPFPTELENETGEWIREKGHEYGVTTGRSRRCGWLDLVILKTAVRVSGLTSLVVTKIDTLAGLDKVKVCTGYKFNGEVIDYFPASLEDLAKCEPIYEEFDGWDESVANARSFDELHENAKKYLNRIEELTDTRISIVSVGPKRSQTIRVKEI